MRFPVGTFLFLACSVLSISASAQSLPDLGAPGTISLMSSELGLHNHAVATDQQTVRLTRYDNRQAGSAALPRICAKEYKVSFELNAGSDTSANGGAGFYIFRTREERHEGGGTWGEWFPAAKTGAGEQNRLDLLHFDTWRDWITVNGQTVYQRDANSVYFWNVAGGGHQDVLGINALLNEPMPFPMEATGFFNVTMHSKEGKLTVQVSRAGVTLLTRAVDTFYAERTPHFVIVSAWTGASKNEQWVRNVRFEGIVPDDCAPPMSRDELQDELFGSCGAYTPETCPALCVRSTAAGLFEQGKIGLDLFESVVTSCEAGLCEKAKRDSFDAGSAAGYAAGYAAGVASVDVQSLKAASYKEGFEAGKASVDVESIRRAAYEEGRAAGYAQGVTDGYAAGFEEGKASVTCEDEEEDDETIKEKIKEAFLKGLKAKKVTLCHKVPQKHDQTLTVGRAAVAAHLAHGDELGECEEEKEKGKDK